VLLQNPIKVKGELATGCKSSRPGQIVLPDSLSLGVLSIASRTRPFQCAFRSCQSIFSCNDEAFPTVQVPLPGKELLPKLDNHHRRGHHV
jgi:hypothetical protein